MTSGAIQHVLIVLSLTVGVGPCASGCVRAFRHGSFLACLTMGVATGVWLALFVLFAGPR